MIFAMKNHTKIFVLLIIIIVMNNTDASWGDILSTKHNLSVRGRGSLTASEEGRVCIFCHTTKRKRHNFKHLWNRKTKATFYTPYKSSTLSSNVGQPTGASRICLSCHDGTIALGAINSRQKEIPFKGGIRVMPMQRSARLGTDLSDDHPVSFVYDSGLALEDSELAHPSTLPVQIQLDSTGQLQCTACHDPHDDTFGKFLVMSNLYSALCTACHQKTGWAISSHATSHARWNGQGVDPWPRTDYQSVSENGCKNCHRTHTAGSQERLLNYAFEEDNCLVCHNGNVAQTNVETEITKRYRHSVQDYMGTHNAAEDFGSQNVSKHVECEDCHNPHQINNENSPDASWVSGANKGVKGVNDGGQQIPVSQKIYEICFKCHADDNNNVVNTMIITRQIDQLNTRMEFALGNPSFHPVGAIGQNTDVPSLLPAFTTNSIISCIDCHNSDNPTGPNGPHGSNFKYILERNYTTADYTTESSNSYALCYKCHSRNSILNNESFSEHNRHIADEKTPCAICHDPHGISIDQGNYTNNSHLINFEITVVSPNDAGNLYFEDNGRYAGSCSLKCHDKNHEGEAYPQL
jgi:predicted CXXCH cytochrome family protein